VDECKPLMFGVTVFMLFDIIRNLPYYYQVTNYVRQGRGAIENKHSTEVQSPPTPPLVCMRIVG